MTTKPAYPDPVAVPDVLDEESAAKLDALYDRLTSLREVSIGYPCNHQFDYAPLYRFMEFAVNNLGDPFAGSNFPMNTHDFEREVIMTFARLTGISGDECWGYVTNGGTEGNMYGLYLARELYPDGIAYFSEDTHYSVSKILRLQHTRNIMIRSGPTGEMDYRDLEESIRIHRDVPPIVFANAGTTMTGAIDRLDRIRDVLHRQCIPNAYIHVDAAFSGMILPFVDDAPPWHFGDGADSISISGHKMIGAPLPCGVAMVRKSHMERISRSVELVGSLDTTITGSRNGLTPLMLWYALRLHGDDGFRELIAESLRKAAYAEKALNRIGVKAWRNPHSVTVVFPRPPVAILEKWVLACTGKITHFIVLPSFSRETLDEFIDDMQRETVRTEKSRRPHE